MQGAHRANTALTHQLELSSVFGRLTGWSVIPDGAPVLPVLALILGMPHTPERSRDSFVGFVSPRDTDTHPEGQQGWGN